MKSSKRTVAVIVTGGLAVSAVAACSGSASSTGDAQEDYSPGESITMIVPFAAGGGSDIAGRAVAGGLEDVTGSTVTVENIVGGSGAVGYSELLGRATDGTTLLASETALITLPLVQDVPFTYEDFTPIMKVGEDFSVVVVGADSPYQSCGDLVSAADEISVGTSGTSGPEFIAWSLVESQENVGFEYVNFESGGEVVAGLMGGHIDAAALNPGEVSGQLESGDLKGLCVFGPDRYEYEGLSDIPTAPEQGIDVTFAQWRGIIAGGEISEEDRQYWIDAAREFENSQAYDAYVEENLLQPSTAYGEEFAQYLDEYSASAEEALADD